MNFAKWRASERDALIEFSKQAQVPAGFGYLDENGKCLAEAGCALWNNGRFTHVYACEVLRGNHQLRPLLKHGVNALLNNFFDTEYGGYFGTIKTTVDQAGQAWPNTATDLEKQAYSHAFVILAACSALQAEEPAAPQLLAQALATFEKYWWDKQAGRVYESFDRSFQTAEAYRGINANMHTTEALLALYDATDEQQYLDRALGIISFVLNLAEANNWFIPEHYTATWEVDQNYNREKPADPFRPWGATIGHSFEWARLALQAIALGLRGVVTQEQTKALGKLAKAALALIGQAQRYGWAAEGQPGFVYTTDFTGKVIVHERMHWVVCEALNAAWAAGQFLTEFPRLLPGPTGQESSESAPTHCAEAAQKTHVEREQMGVSAPRLTAWYEQWWDYTRRYLIAAPGQWNHELDRHNQLSQRTWAGRPEIYHAYQALIYPDQDYARGFAKGSKIIGLKVG